MNRLAISKRVCVSLLGSALLVLSVGCPFGGISTPTDTTTRLQDSRIGLTIAGSTTTGTATVLAVLVDDRGRPVDLEDDQSIEVNDTELERDSDGRYSATVDISDSYVLRVREPTRGVEETTLATPTQFQITAPLSTDIVSLSGFTINWDQVNAAFDTTVRISQSVLGVDRSEEFGPSPDSGSQSVTSDDLVNWQHGGDITLTISVVKQARQTNVAGFENADVSVELTATVVTTPGP